MLPSQYHGLLTMIALVGASAALPPSFSRFLGFTAATIWFLLNQARNLRAERRLEERARKGPLP